MMAPIVFQDFAYPNSEPNAMPDPFSMERDGGSIKQFSASAFAELLSGPTIDIIVGSERRHWRLHLNLLCHHSPYFESEFGTHEDIKDAQASREPSLELPEYDSSGFELLVKWLYQGQLDEATAETDVERYDYAVACQKLYLLCDDFDMFSLKNRAMDAYRASLHAAQLVPDADESDAIYRSSPKESPMRRLMAHIAARQIMDPESAKGAEAYREGFDHNTGFAIDVINAIRNMSGGILLEDPTSGSGCEWHDHSDGGGCVEGETPMIPNAHAPRRWHRKVRATESKQVKLDSSRDSMPVSVDLPRTPSNTSDEISAQISRTTRQLHGITEEKSPVRDIANSASLSTPKQATSSIAMNESRKLTPPTPESNKSSPKKPNADASTPKKSPSNLAYSTSHESFPRRVVSRAAAFDTPKPVKGHVNGIVRQINGTRSPSEASSGRRPKKLELRGTE